MANIRKNKWVRDEIVRVFEVVLEKGSDLFSSPNFRKYLNRDQSLIANQLIREGNGNIAYRSVNFKIDETVSDEQFWDRIEKTPYQDLIEENAAAAMVKMAEKLKILDD